MADKKNKGNNKPLLIPLAFVLAAAVGTVVINCNNPNDCGGQAHKVNFLGTCYSC
jgi:hypothetical protein